MIVEAQWEMDKRNIGHWAIVTDAYRPKAWCKTCWEAWPCQTAEEWYARRVLGDNDE
jgi:hypothetical protein